MEVNKLIEEISNTIKRDYPFNQACIFDFLCKTSVIKSVEISLIITMDNSKENSFLHLSLIRGMCEEYMMLKFLKTSINPDHVDELLQLTMQLQTKKDINNQVAFFNKYRPFQESVKLKENAFDSNINRIAEILNLNGINGRKMPPTEQLATRIGENDLYDFIFRGTSAFVHFNPRTLLRTAWAKEGSNEYNISIENFKDYYHHFCTFYAPFLMVKMLDEFRTRIVCGEEFESHFVKLKDGLNQLVEIPEMITFEELNRERPKKTLTIMNIFSNNKLFD